MDAGDGSLFGDFLPLLIQIGFSVLDTGTIPIITVDTIPTIIEAMPMVVVEGGIMDTKAQEMTMAPGGIIIIMETGTGVMEMAAGLQGSEARGQ
jgi:hypothetical protein